MNKEDRYPPVFESSTLADIAQECLRQRVKHPHRPLIRRHQGVSILVEEMLEVVRAINDEEPRERVIAELIQVAAVCVSWIEEIRSEIASPGSPLIRW